MVNITQTHADFPFLPKQNAKKGTKLQCRKKKSNIEVHGLLCYSGNQHKRRGQHIVIMKDMILEEKIHWRAAWSHAATLDCTFDAARVPHKLLVESSVLAQINKWLHTFNKPRNMIPKWVLLAKNRQPTLRLHRYSNRLWQLKI